MLTARDLRRILTPLEVTVLLVARTVPAKSSGRWKEVARQVKWAGDYPVSEIGCEDAFDRARKKISQAAARAEAPAPPRVRKREAPVYRPPRKEKPMQTETKINGAVAGSAAAKTDERYRVVDVRETPVPDPEEPQAVGEKQWTPESVHAEAERRRAARAADGPYSLEPAERTAERMKAARERQERRDREAEAMRERHRAEVAEIDAEEGFAERIERETREEAERVCAELTKLRFDARQVQRVMKALGLTIPREIAWAASEKTVMIVDELPEQPPAASPAPAASKEAAGSSPEPATAETAPIESAAEPVKPPKQRPSAGGTPRVAADVDWPADLMAMPAASGNGPVRPRRVAAEKQLAVYNDVEAHRTRIPGEVADAVGMKSETVASILRELHRHGMIVRTGVNRRKPGQKTGRASVEYRPLVRLKDPAEVDQAPAKPKTPAPPQTKVTSKVASVPKSTKLGVEDFLAKQGVGQTFTLGGLCDDLPGADPEHLENWLRHLVVKQKVAQDGSSYAVLVAADINAPKKTGSGPRIASGSVAGTGKSKVRSSNPGVQALMNEARQAGATVTKTGGDHIRYEWEQGGVKRVVTGSASPSTERAVRDTRADLRRGGLAV